MYKSIEVRMTEKRDSSNEMWCKSRKEITIKQRKLRIFYHVYEFTKFKKEIKILVIIYDNFKQYLQRS